MSNRKARALIGACMISALCLTATAGAEVAQKGNLRVSFQGQISPHALPRHGAAPISVTLGGEVTSTAKGKKPAQLKTIRVAINRNGQMDRTGLPTCRYEDVQPSTTQNAMAACGDAKVGEGTFSADVLIPEQSPFPSKGEVTVFNGTEDGKPVLFAHVYGTAPIPISYTLPLRITEAKGTFGTVLSASLPEVTSEVAFVTGLSLTLERRFTYRGKSRSFLSAGCPAPKGFGGASFPLAKASFGFVGGKVLSSTLTRSCSAVGG